MTGGWLRRSVAAAALTLVVAASHADTPTDIAAIPSALAADRLVLDITLLDGRLIAVGEQGHIVVSDDDGVTWKHASVPVSVMLTGVTSSGPQTLWAVGHDGVVLRSDDRGDNWTMPLDGRGIVALQIDAAMREIERREAELAAISEESPDMESALLALEDAQFDLEDAEMIAEDGLTSPLLGATFISAKVGFVYGAYGVFLATEDGGDNWTLVSGRLDNPNNNHLYALAQSAGGSLFIAGEAGALFRSDDMGGSWQRLDPGYGGSLFGLVAGSDNSMLAYGLRGRIFRSTDNGDSWTGIDNPRRATLLDATQSVDGSLVLVGSGGTMLSSRDNGASFQAMETGTRDPLSAVSRNRAGDLVVAGFQGVRPLTPRLSSE